MDRDDLSMRIQALESEVAYLKSILDSHGIKYDNGMVCKAEDRSSSAEIVFPEITEDHARLLYSYFKGRRDVYSHRIQFPDGAVYIPQCKNRRSYHLCPKKTGKNIKCAECPNKDYIPLSRSALMAHLKGERKDCNDVIGIYPLLPDGTCNFLVFDFDDHNSDGSILWQHDVDAFSKICIINGIDPLVERSRSGNGAHVWIFFSEPISASRAREFGAALITKGLESVDVPDFKYYDRMMPMQDCLQKGKLGNLIALPLQGQALKNGNSAFVDEHWFPYQDQWAKLKSVRKLSPIEVYDKITEWGEGKDPLGILSDSDTENKEKPWKSADTVFDPDDISGRMEIILANGIYVRKDNVKPRLLNLLRREAAYSNPEFYRNLAMGFDTRNIPRIIYKGYDSGGYLCLPRGCENKLIAKLNSSFIPYNLKDERQKGRSIEVSFNGSLYPEQEVAAKAMLNYENGILSAATAFGKTVVGSYMIVSRKVNTLILVRNSEILKNWIEDLNRFLIIKEELPEYKTRTGRVRRRKELIGCLQSTTNTLTGIVDVAMITSLGKAGSINSIVKNYGMVINDECHHAAAETDEAVLMEVNAKYVYGLTATPKRDDGQVKSVFFQIGPIRHTYSAKDRALKQGIGHYVYPRFTRLVDLDEDKHSISDTYRIVVENELRNELIVKDILDSVQSGRTPIVISKFVNHAELLYNKLLDKVNHVFLLKGGRSSKERDRVRALMNAVPENENMIVVATGSYIGEGFNFPRLDTLFIAAPIRSENNVEQFAGRINRDYEGKKDVVIYDYIDQHVKVLDRMYHKRLRTYRQIGYEICSDIHSEMAPKNAIYDFQNYKDIYKDDLKNAAKEIIISSPWVSSGKSWELICLVAEFQEKNRNVKIHVMTRPAELYEELEFEMRQRLQGLKEMGITLHLSEKCHERYAVIDRNIVWYGSMNLLAKEKDTDNLIRIVSREVAEELICLSEIR